MKPLKWKTTKDILPSEYSWIKRKVEKEEVFSIDTSGSKKCISENGIKLLDTNNHKITLPFALLSFEYQKKTYGIFMVESKGDQECLYCREQPFGYIETLNKIQSPTENVNGVAENDEILTITFSSNHTTVETSNLAVIEPLF
jgi:hypothetical protein